MNWKSLFVACAIHVVLLLALVLAAHVRFHKKEVIVPIDMTVVLNENLDGEENEPPPTRKVEPPKPEPPKPRPKVKETPPEEKNQPAVVQVKEKPKEKKVDPPKEKEKPKEKKPEPPKEKKKTRAEQIREKMQNEKVKIEAPKQPTGNGRTDKATLSIEERLKALANGAKAGTKDQLPKSEEQRCVSLIQREFEAKWDQVGRPAWTSSLRTMLLDVTFGANGRVLGYRLSQGSGTPAADQTVLKAAALVKVVSGLSDSFLRANKTVTVRFKVTP